MLNCEVIAQRFAPCDNKHLIEFLIMEIFIAGILTLNGRFVLVLSLVYESLEKFVAVAKIPFKILSFFFC